MKEVIRFSTGVLGVILLFGLVLGVFSSVAFSAEGGAVGTVSDGILDRILTFFHTAAGVIGKGLVSLVNLIAGVDVSELEEPLGYLGILTASLVLFGAIKAAQKVVWFIILLGWGLIIIRIVLEVLGQNPGT